MGSVFPGRGAPSGGAEAAAPCAAPASPVPSGPGRGWVIQPREITGTGHAALPPWRRAARRGAQSRREAARREGHFPCSGASAGGGWPELRGKEDGGREVAVLFASLVQVGVPQTRV